MIPSKTLRYLNAGEMIVTGDDVLISTVLGSCVSVVVHDPKRCTTGINHYLLPESAEEESLRFGRFAIPELLRAFKKAGSHPSDLKIQVLGGAHLTQNSQVAVGAQNVAIAREILGKFKLPIDREDVGSFAGRRVIVECRTGNLWIKRLDNAQTGPSQEDFSSTSNSHLIALGASTGGTQALQDLLQSLPAGLPPIVIVQHMPEDFTATFAESLSRLSAFQVSQARQGELIQAGRAYLAPGNQHMRVRLGERGLWLDLRQDPPVNGFRPSVDVLFESLVGVKRKIVAALLTGMGQDGAQGMLKLRGHGARTFAQDESTSVVYGMPKVAAEIGAAEKILALQEIGPAILKALRERKRIRAA
jgi:chemotaxis response regulator CheB